MALTLRGIHRHGLWVILIILTITLLVFPTHLTLEYYDIQSTRIFDNLPLFAGLFCVWLATLLLLLFSRNDKGENEWEKLGLVCIFSMVFICFWTILTYDVGRGEGLFNIAHVKYLNEVGRIPVAHRILSYFDFPGLHLIGSFVSQVIRLDPITCAAVILFVQAVFLAALLYVLFRRFMSNSTTASLAVLLVIQGNIWIAKLNIFHPRNLGLVLLVTFLVIISRYPKGIFRTVPDTIIILVVALAATMTHFVTSFLLFFIMLGIYIVQKLGRSNLENASTLIVLLVFPLTWAIYWSLISFGGTMQYISMALQNWFGGEEGLWTIFMSLQANVGGEMPLWSNIARLYWWVVIYGFGSILGMLNLFKIKKLMPMEKTATGILLSFIIVSVVSTVASRGGERFDTYILYGAFAAVPILLWFLLRLRKYVFGGFVAAFFILSFPTFLTSNNMIEQSAFYYDEHAASKFLDYQYDAPGIYLLEPETRFITCYYDTNDHFYGVRVISQMRDESGLWADVEWSYNSFMDWPSDPAQPIIFLFTKRSTMYYQHFFGVKPENPKWQELKDKLSYQNQIYESGNIQIFLR